MSERSDERARLFGATPRPVRVRASVADSALQRAVARGRGELRAEIAEDLLETGDLTGHRADADAQRPNAGAALPR